MTKPKIGFENDTWETGVANRGPPGGAALPPPPRQRLAELPSLIAADRSSEGHKHHLGKTRRGEGRNAEENNFKA